MESQGRRRMLVAIYILEQKPIGLSLHGMLRVRYAVMALLPLPRC